jgi:formylglycine-generating enzyme required for sulfatase activity
MKQRAGLSMCIIALLFASACAACATGGGRGGQDGFDEAGISARGAVGRLDALSGPLWTGEGGKDIRLAVLAPEAMGGAPGYLPMYIQGLLNSNLKRHSAMTLIDRQNLDRIIAEQKLSASGLYSDKDLVNIGKLTNAQYVLAGSLQKLSGSAYALQLSVTEVSSGEHKAVFTGNGSLAQIEGSGSLINQASEELLAQLGVNLTEAGRLSLMGGNTFMARAENAYAKGVAAQATGDQLEALFSYAQAASFDPGQLEALARLGSLSSTISGGSISERIMNDIQARDRWVDVFRETARFYNEHPPYELIFDPSLEQEGKTDYAKRTATLVMRVGLVPSEAGFAALNALLEGLEQTGRRETWGFAGWPLEDLKPKVKGTALFNGKDAGSFTVEVLLLNDKQKQVGKGSVILSSAPGFATGRKSVTPPGGRFDIIRFQNVKADELSPVLTIVINSVNGIPSKTLNTTGYMRIAPGDVAAVKKASLEAANMVWIEGGTFTMGSPVSEAARSGSEVQHQVTVSTFYMGKYEVTQKEWREVMGNNPSYFKGDNLPVEQMSWYEAVEYCNKRSQREGLTPAYTINGTNVSWNRNADGYRLPTEAEWEYACRAGTSSPFSTGNNITTGQANYDGNYPYNDNTKGTYRIKTVEVGNFAPNPWGLYDMHGNVWEWCWDWYGDYPSGAQTDPAGASTGADRVLRGGSWYIYAAWLRSAFRYYLAPSYRYYYIGFRLVRSP